MNLLLVSLLLLSKYASCLDPGGQNPDVHQSQAAAGSQEQIENPSVEQAGDSADNVTDETVHSGNAEESHLVDETKEVKEHMNVGDVLRDLEQTILDSKINSSHSTFEQAEDDLLLSEGTNLSKTEKTTPRMHCIQVNRTGIPRVQLLNGTEIQVRVTEENNSNITNRTFPADCSIIFFYGSWCNFSAKAAPYYNALPRFYPGINFFAIEASNNINIFAQFGVISIPSMLVFHNGRPLYSFNNSEHSLDMYIQFISPLTGIPPEQLPLNLTQQDLIGPMPTIAIKPFNYNLVLAVLFLVLCALFNLSKSFYFRNMLDNLRNAWREAEIQHEHTD